ncbi:MAG: DNA gyrase inhibitor YacG [Rhodobacteraceae bacterium]|nr:MAG: DNA gyrase inhibitor YacG [Paracoccaceae bacterium]
MTCPICKRETVRDFRPFCSRRCADVDLGRWVSGAYAVPSRDPEDVERAIDAVEEILRNSARPH